MDSRVATQRSLDLAQFDSEPSDLDLMIQSTEMHDATIRAIPRQVSRSIQSREGLLRKWMRDEPLLCQIRPPVIASGQSMASDIELAGNSDGNWLEGLIQDLHFCIGNWSPNGDLSIIPFDSLDRGPNRGFGRAIHIPQGNASIQQ